MRRLASAALLIAVLFADPALADPMSPFCKTLRGLADQARQSHEPQRITASVNLAGPADCRPATDNAAIRAFCEAAAQESGLAWRIHGCVDSLAAQPQTVTRDEHAELRTRKAIVHLTAGLAHGARLDLSETAGRYDIVVWAPE